MRKLSVLLVLCCFGMASADLLWDQSTLGANNFVDQEFGDFPDYSSYMVNDVVTDPGGWNVTDVHTYYTNTSSGGLWGGITHGRLIIWPKVGNLPTEDPATGLDVAITVTNTGLCYEAHAANLDINLDSSTEYWVGLTPIGGFGAVGQEFHLDTPKIGADTAWRNPGGMFGHGNQWQTLPVPGYFYEDASLKVEGTIIPEPAGLLLLGLAGLLIRRR